MTTKAMTVDWPEALTAEWQRIPAILFPDRPDLAGILADLLTRLSPDCLAVRDAMVRALVGTLVDTVDSWDLEPHPCTGASMVVKALEGFLSEKMDRVFMEGA